MATLGTIGTVAVAQGVFLVGIRPILFTKGIPRADS